MKYLLVVLLQYAVRLIDSEPMMGHTERGDDYSPLEHVVPSVEGQVTKASVTINNSVDATGVERGTISITTAKSSNAKPTTSKRSDPQPVHTNATKEKPTGAQSDETKLTTAKPTDFAPTGIQSTGAQLTGAKPTTAKPTNAKPTNAKPTTAKPPEVRTVAAKPTGPQFRRTKPRPTNAKPTTAKPPGVRTVAAKPTGPQFRRTKSRPTASMDAVSWNVPVIWRGERMDSQYKDVPPRDPRDWNVRLMGTEFWNAQRMRRQPWNAPSMDRQLYGPQLTSTRFRSAYPNTRTTKAKPTKTRKHAKAKLAADEPTDTTPTSINSTDAVVKDNTTTEANPSLGEVMKAWDLSPEGPPYYQSRYTSPWHTDPAMNSWGLPPENIFSLGPGIAKSNGDRVKDNKPLFAPEMEETFMILLQCVVLLTDSAAIMGGTKRQNDDAPPDEGEATLTSPSVGNSTEIEYKPTATSENSTSGKPEGAQPTDAEPKTATPTSTDSKSKNKCGSFNESEQYSIESEEELFQIQNIVYNEEPTFTDDPYYGDSYDQEDS